MSVSHFPGGSICTFPSLLPFRNPDLPSPDLSTSSFRLPLRKSRHRNRSASSPLRSTAIDKHLRMPVRQVPVRLPVNVRVRLDHRRPILLPVALRISPSHANDQRTFHSIREIEHQGIASGYPVGRYGETTQSIVGVYVHPRLVEDEVELLSVITVVIIIVITVVISSSSIIIVERMSLDALQPMSQRRQVSGVVAPRRQFHVEVGPLLPREVVRRAVHGECPDGGVVGEEGRVSVSLVYVQVYD
mmetsp:Transcript_9506/g.17093  ORF Transcript_9506/g.17093 Transcript_9506/m.17093 type:complete len:245 (-) Transcript_9506:62-796(-)